MTVVADDVVEIDRLKSVCEYVTVTEGDDEILV